VKKERREVAHDKRVQTVYGLEPGEYQQLYLFQGGRCPGCLRATGTGKKKLATDHDHITGEVRGLLCSTCNQIVGHLRDDPEAFRRFARYLEDPPRRRMRVSKGPDQDGN
jgi:hypothetical protein